MFWQYIAGIVADVKKSGDYINSLFAFFSTVSITLVIEHVIIKSGIETVKLKQLKAVIDQCVDCAGDCDPDVEIWIGDKKAYKIGRIGQYGVVPDVLISVGEKVYDAKQFGELKG